MIRSGRYFPVVREEKPEPKVVHSEGREKYGHKNHLSF